MKKILWVLILLTPTTGIWAQTSPQLTQNSSAPQQTSGQYKSLMQMTSADYLNLHMPPLHVLLANARERSPQVNMFDSNRAYEDRELKNIRRNWLNFFKINSTFSYGTSDASSQIYYDNPQLPMVQNLSGSTQRWWNAGASFSMPIGEIFTRRNKIKQQKNRIESIKNEVNSWYDEICLKIVQSYTVAVQNLALLETSAQAMVIAKAQYISAESDFVNGKVSSQTLNVQKSMEVSAIREYEKTRSELNRSLLELEILSKTPIISRPEDVLNR